VGRERSDHAYVYLVVADDYSRWGYVCEQIENEEGLAVRLVCGALADLVEGKIDPKMCDIIVAKFNYGHEILAVQENYPLARLVLGVAGVVTNELLELLTVAPLGILRIPPRVHEVQELVQCSMATSVHSLPKMSMRASFKSREVGSLKMVFSLGERLVTAGIIKEKDWRGLRVAFQEALTNSLEHGNLELQSEWKDEMDSAGKDRYTVEKKRRLNQEKYGERLLKIESVYDGSSLIVSIEDEGQGFNVKSLAERPPSSVEACYGRGFSLIFAYMDTVRFNSLGTKIIMTKHLGEV
jgi:anti-sigma regulatory factor (Ser/Thr protein kinase)